MICERGGLSRSLRVEGAVFRMWLPAPGHRRRPCITAAVVTALAGSLAVPPAWLGWRAIQARDHLLAAATLADGAQTLLRAGDLPAARARLVALRSEAGAARAAVTGPAWRAGMVLPYLGDDLVAVRGVAVAVDDLSRRVLPALATLEPARLAPSGGRYDVAYLHDVLPALAGADDALGAIRRRLDAVPVGGLTAQVGSAVTRLRTGLDQLAGTTAALRRTAALLPPLLGAGGPRTYLLVCQNLAELRATGGMWGAYAVLHADHGAVSMSAQGSTPASSPLTDRAGSLGADFANLYGVRPLTFAADANLTPHFPTAAALYAEMYRRSTGSTVDGVLAADPVGLSYLLGVTGPVAVPGQPTLTAANVVRELLSESYRRLDGLEQNGYFADSARAVFAALLTRPVAPAGLLAALSRTVAERRLLFWTIHPAEQREIAATRLGGTLPATENAPTVGMFLNDGSGGKLDYYLNAEVTLTPGGCDARGRRGLHLRLVLSSTAPPSGLSRWVMGESMTGDGRVARTLV